MTLRVRLLRVFLVVLALGVSAAAATGTKTATAATPASAPNEIRITMPGAPGAGSLSWSIVALLTFLTLIPSLLLCMTPFARLLIVFHFLRQALGLQTTPTNQTLIGLALILTFFLMQPVGASIYTQAVGPLEEGQITAMDALQRGTAPLHQFMTHYVREKDVALFVDLAKEARPHDPSDLSMRILVPAYILSELKAGFQIGAVLFPSLHGDRHGGGFHYHFGGHVAVAAGGDLDPAQTASVRDGQRLGLADWFADEEL